MKFLTKAKTQRKQNGHLNRMAIEIKAIPKTKTNNPNTNLQTKQKRKIR